MRPRIPAFSLMEVVVSMVIFSISLSISMQMTSHYLSKPGLIENHELSRKIIRHHYEFIGLQAETTEPEIKRRMQYSYPFISIEYRLEGSGPYSRKFYRFQP